MHFLVTCFAFYIESIWFFFRFNKFIHSMNFILTTWQSKFIYGRNVEIFYCKLGGKIFFQLLFVPLFEFCINRFRHFAHLKIISTINHWNKWNIKKLKSHIVNGENVCATDSNGTKEKTKFINFLEKKFAPLKPKLVFSQNQVFFLRISKRIFAHIRTHIALKIAFSVT